MPELSRFFGIIIRMFAEPLERHHTAHFHAYYQEHVAVFSISPVALIDSSTAAATGGGLGRASPGRAAFRLESSSRGSSTCTNRPSAVE